MTNYWSCNFEKAKTDHYIISEKRNDFLGIVESYTICGKTIFVSLDVLSQHSTNRKHCKKCELLLKNKNLIGSI